MVRIGRLALLAALVAALFRGEAILPEGLGLKVCLVVFPNRGTPT